MLRTPLIRNTFSIISTHRHPTTRTFRGVEVVLDTHDSLRHHELMVAMKEKRALSKNEVWPMVATVDQNIQELERDLNQQSIGVKQIELQDAIDGNVSLSEKILLKFKEPYLVQLLGAYLSKVLVNGRMPSMSDLVNYNSIRQKVISLYRAFFFSQPMTPLQQTLQLHYLHIKKEKFQKVRSESFKCFWTQEDTRGINKYDNWQNRPKEHYANDRPFYIPYKVEERLESEETINDMMTLVLPFNLKWKLMSRYEFIAGSKLYFDGVNHEHMHRIMKYLNCEEFLNFINLPADFEIEMAIIDCHIWMLIDRIKKIKNAKYKYLATRLQTSLKSHGINKVSHLAVKKPDRFAKVIKSSTDKHFKAFTYHFNMAGFSRDNLYKGIDALVWSNVFMQKVERYSDIVYRFSEYFVKNYLKIQNQPIESINQCMMEFDIHLQEPGYKQKIQSINPRVPQEQFQKQFAEDKDIKSYYYNYLVQQDKDVIHYSQVYSNENKDMKEIEMGREVREHIVSGWEKEGDSVKQWKSQSIDHLKQATGGKVNGGF